MNRQQQERAEREFQIRTRAVDFACQKIENTRNLINSYLTDAQQEIEARDTDSRFSVYDNLPLAYWKGRESLAIELLSKLEKHNKEVRDILELLV